jgi:predicted nuclease of predicted toxin-antitoxin system
VRFLLDESADYPLARLLASMGHDVKSIVKDFTTAISDEEVLALAVAEDRIVLTNDRDFGELVYRRALPHRGIILLRLGDEDLDAKRAWLRRALELPESDLRAFVVVTDRAIRVRRRATPLDADSDA